MSSKITKSHTFSWQDPISTAKEGLNLGGLEYLRKLLSGEIPPPPMFALMNARLLEIEEGRARFEAEPQEYHYNPIGSVHGGFAATILDSAMGCAIHSLLHAQVNYTTLEIKINYIRPLTGKTGIVSCEGKAIHVGGRVATADGQIIDGNGNLYAHGTTTCLILK
jgi:uncharacterized protein (TIGR00369 family)